MRAIFRAYTAGPSPSIKIVALINCLRYRASQITPIKSLVVVYHRFKSVRLVHSLVISATMVVRSCIAVQVGKEFIAIRKERSAVSVRACSLTLM